MRGYGHSAPSSGEFHGTVQDELSFRGGNDEHLHVIPPHAKRLMATAKCDDGETAPFGWNVPVICAGTKFARGFISAKRWE